MILFLGFFKSKNGGIVLEKRFETFTVLINKISRNIRKIKNQEMAEYNLRSSHISCLYYLYISKKLTATQLCERSAEDKATISRSLDYLETNGYLICESKNAKRYKSLLYLTDKGNEVGKKIADKITDVLKKTSEGLSDEELENFYRGLSIISNNLDFVARKCEK